MLTITIGATESFDESNSEFVNTGGIVVELEHSLVSLSKWEAEFEKPFISKDEKTPEELLAYVRCMALDSKISPEVFLKLSEDNYREINDYLNRKMTATWFGDAGEPPKTGSAITSELIYYWMTALNIPWEAQHWHLSRLFTLLKVADVKNAKPKKLTRQQAAERNRKLNEQRRQQYNTRG